MDINENDHVKVNDYQITRECDKKKKNLFESELK